VVPKPCAAKTKVDRVRYSVNDYRTRVVLDVSGRCGYKVAFHKNPHRIAVNIPDVRAARTLEPVNLPRGVVKKVRVNRLSWGVQVVFDLTEPAGCKHFGLSDAEGRPNRLVFDVSSRSSAEQTAGTQVVRTPKKGGKLYVVAVDAGHGGSDPGTSGRYGLVEKNLVLDIAKRIARRINDTEGYKAVLTRSSDVYLTLPRRTRIADAKGADVFVSIHLNSAPNRAARGAEVFFLSPAGAAATASKVLSNPNRAASKLGLKGSNSSDLLHMLVDVNQQAVLARSELLGESILYALHQKGLPPTRSIKQKSFSVLRTITMPSVLIEAGFLTNVADANIIRTAKGRDRIAGAITNGIMAFFAKHPPQRTERETVIVHKVKKGDNLWKISRKYGTTIASLRRVNKMGKSSTLRIGQELLISNGY
jgi:N-acetylmuramoyl-L-alanine amidase